MAKPASKKRASLAGEMLGKVAKDQPASPLTKVSRKNLGQPMTLVLFVRAGGRCERRGCNKVLIEQEVSKQPGNFADKAHIVAFSESGPRSHDGKRPVNVDTLDNLMLLCKGCHKEIDDHPQRYPCADLVAMKTEHELRVETLLNLAPENKSHIITLTAPIGGFQVAIPRGDAFDAMQPRHPVNGNVTQIDLTSGRGLDEDENLMTHSCKLIDTRLNEALQDGGPIQEAGHISVFGFGPIPLLIYLGSRLGDKVPADLFQRHRDTENWNWKPENDFEAVKYVHTCLQDKGDKAPVGIILSLSGKIGLSTLPDDVLATHTLYELVLDSVEPSPTFLNCRRDLTAFREAWHDLQSHIAGKHGDTQPLAVFPAIPAPIAIACGRDRLPKARPRLIIYDNDRKRGGFTKLLEID